MTHRYLAYDVRHMRVRLSNVKLHRDWQSPSSVPRLRHDQLLVWRATLDPDPYSLPQLKDVLSPDEVERACSFKFEQHRRRFIAARATLRVILAHLLDASPHAVEFSQGSHGKPELAGPTSESGIRFNISHSEDVALFAFALQREVGVDVEVHRTIEEPEVLAARFFSNRESAMLRALPDSDRSREFLRLWAYREACVKSSGEGLMFPLDRIEIRVGEPRNARWTLFPIPRCDRIVGAAVVAGSECDAVFLNWRC